LLQEEALKLKSLDVKSFHEAYVQKACNKACLIYKQ